VTCKQLVAQHASEGCLTEAAVLLESGAEHLCMVMQMILLMLSVSHLPVSAAMAYAPQPQQLLQRQPRAKQQRRTRSVRQRKQMVTVQQHHKGEWRMGLGT
jgi:hypothetical protein